VKFGGKTSQGGKEGENPGGEVYKSEAWVV
jgi:hypothetical protein